MSYVRGFIGKVGVVCDMILRKPSLCGIQNIWRKMVKTSSISNERVKEQILIALNHPEAQEGLYFRNFHHLHEEDERSGVEGTEVQILDALKELIKEGQVSVSDDKTDPIFSLKSLGLGGSPNDSA